jgi:hypothetical protein
MLIFGAFLLAGFASGSQFEAQVEEVARLFHKDVTELRTSLAFVSLSEVSTPCVCASAGKNSTAAAAHNSSDTCKCKKALLDVQSLLKTMYSRFKADIVSASRLEEKSKKFFHGKTSGETATAKAYAGTRSASHEHYRALLKTAHAGMDRLLTAMGLVDSALEGNKVPESQIKALKSSMPATSSSASKAGAVAVKGIKADLLQYCREAEIAIATGVERSEAQGRMNLRGATSSRSHAENPPQLAAIKAKVVQSAVFQKRVSEMESQLCLKADDHGKSASCTSYVQDLLFCLEFAQDMTSMQKVDGASAESSSCKSIDTKMPAGISLLLRKQKWTAKASPKPLGLLQQDPAPEDQLAKEMSHDLEMNFNKIAPFGKEDTAKELQDHAADTQDTLVDAVENAEVAEIKRAVFRALTRLRAATIKEFDTIARLETQAIDAYNDAHHYRAENPLSHLHEDEAPVETDKLKSFH